MVLINKRFIWSHTTSGVDAGTAPLRASFHTLASSGGSTSTLNSGIYYIYDGKRVIQERDTNNSPTVSYTRGNDLSGTLAGAGGIGGLLARTDGSGSTFYHADVNGNITYLETGSQGLGARYRYDPFGNVTSSSGAYATANTYRFSSKEWVPSVNGYYYLYRFYVPGIERWLNRDPLAEIGFVNIFSPHSLNNWLSMLRPYEKIGGLNPFNFARNAPIKFVDKFGMSPVLAPAPPITTIPPDTDGGDKGDLCQMLAQRIMGAAAVLSEDPANINQQIILGEALAAFKAAGCDDPDKTPPPQCPSDEPPARPPWWQRAGSGLLDILDRLGRIPIFIFDPCGPLGDPTLCPGRGPATA